MKKVGSLEVVCGCMFSGKSEELLRRLKRAELARQDVVTVKHNIDDRRSVTCITSHDGTAREADIILEGEESLKFIEKLADQKVDVIGIDEVQFFPNEILDILEMLVESGKRIIVAGLDMDFRGEPFGIMPHLMAKADKVSKLQAVCLECGQPANFTQRLINDLPAKYHDPIVMVGASECYEARCRQCFSIDRPLSARQDSQKELAGV
ncbi:MAG: thymidine kinase [Chlamydiales bacterium]|nr:thymidine kinase [Chlamydiales bacterium]NCF70544.1 thymidine kinase [Chlamydiales bacterium]